MTANSKGYGIIEVVVSATLIIIVLTAVVFATNLAMRNATESTQEMVAYNFAQREIEQIKNTRDVEIFNKDTSPLPDVVDPPRKGDTINSAGIEYTPSITITKEKPVDVQSDQDSNYRKVKVEVSWEGRRGKQLVNLTTYLTTGAAILAGQ